MMGQTAARYSAAAKGEAAHAGGAAQWFGYYAAIGGLFAAGAAVLYKANETNNIRDSFKKVKETQKK